MNKLFFVAGASGSGKTTTMEALDKIGLLGFKTLYFDTIGVPSLEEMQTKYKGPEEWQRIKTIEWVKKIKEEWIAKTHVILDGQIRPAFIEKACCENEIDAYQVILFDCSDEERTQRLIARGQTELANEQMMNWASYLRQESQKRGYLIMDNTHLTREETLSQLLKWILKKD